MKQPALVNIAVRIYDAGWCLLIPVLQLSRRLREGYRKRRLVSGLPRADLWIQAASGGEAYLAWSLVRKLEGPLKILVTTNTRQGMDILEQAGADISAGDSGITLFLEWCPFDRPKIMEQAVCRIDPKLVVLLETEIWPGLFYALKCRRCPALIINGRITRKSFSGYRKIRPLLRLLSPEAILAVSEKDASRFADLFDRDIVYLMPNMKFDILSAEKRPDKAAALPDILNTGTKLLILGSIRRQEEKQVKKLIKHVQFHHPDVIIGLFPRHMHRTKHWRRSLIKTGAHWQLRSKLMAAPEPGCIILWDKFGELAHAYQAADAVFVGGSLAPLGGQNFLEPLIHGCRPVTGPSWENFSWAGEEIFAGRLVLKENNWQAAARQLVRQLENPDEKDKIRKKAEQYISARRGGTKKACRIIGKYLADGSAKEEK